MTVSCAQDLCRTGDRNGASPNIFPLSFRSWRIRKRSFLDVGLPMRPSYDWNEVYDAAIVETDPSKRKARIDAAQAAIVQERAAQTHSYLSPLTVKRG